MKLVIAADPAELALTVAQAVAAFIRANPGRLLSLAAGDTPLAALRELVSMQQRGEVDLNSVGYVGLDEWGGLGPADPGSCIEVMNRHFYHPAGIRPENLCVFNGLAADPEADAAAVLELVARRGPLGLTLLGIGMNGHLGFNEPGTSPDFIGGVVTLDDVTREVGRKYFAGRTPGGTGITLGLGTLGRADRILLMATGEKKRAILTRIAASPDDPALPASHFVNHPAATWYLDRAAAPDTV